MKIMCVDDSCCKGITQGKIYHVNLNEQREDSEFYFFVDNTGVKRGWYKHRFEEVLVDKGKKIKADYRTLYIHFTREELRDYARDIGVKIGKDKADTAMNLCLSNKVYFTINLVKE